MSNIVLTIIVFGLMALSAAVGAAITHRKMQEEHAMELHEAFKAGRRTGASIVKRQAAKVSEKMHGRRHEQFCKQLERQLTGAGIE